MRIRRLAALTAALLLVPATAAWAHPSLNPNQVPVGEPVEATLVVPHGCSTGENVRPEEGEAVPTTRVDLQLLDGITIEPGEVDGWEATDDGEAIVWTDAGGATIDPISFPITLTVDEGSPGDELALAVYQECEDGSSYRWTADSDSTPAVALALTAGETGTMEMEDMGHGSEMDMSGSESDHASEEGMEDMTPPTAEASEASTTADADAQALADAEDEDGSGGTLAAFVAVFVVLLATGTVAVRRKRGSA